MYILKNKDFVIIYILLTISKQHRSSWSLTMKEDAYILKDAVFFYLYYIFYFYISIILIFYMVSNPPAFAIPVSYL